MSQLDFDERPASAPKKRSGCWTAALILGVTGGVVMLVCCGVGGWFAYQFQPTLAQTDPEVRQFVSEIAPLEIPADLRGKTGVKMDNNFMAMRMCAFEHQDGRGQMLVSEIQVKFGDQRDQEAELKAQMKKQGAAEMRTLNVEETETREITINGQPAQFTFSSGQDAGTSTKYHEVQGQFTGKNGPATLHLQLESEVWDAAAVEKMLEAAK